MCSNTPYSLEIDLIPLLVTFLSCLFISLEYGILIGTAVNLAMLLYSTSRPRIKIHHIKETTVEYVSVVPDRSLVFSAMDYFMSAVRKAAVGHREPYPLPIVIDLRHVSMADFSTAYGFHLLSEDMHKRGHQVVVKNTQPKVLSILLGVEPSHLAVLPDGTKMETFLQGIFVPREVRFNETLTPYLSYLDFISANVAESMSSSRTSVSSGS